MARTEDVCGIHFGPIPGILFNRPEHVQSILVEHAYDFDKGATLLYRGLPSAIRDGITCSEGNLHRRQRKLMAPPFQPRHIASYGDIIGCYGERALQTWSDGAVIDISQQMTNLTMRIIGKVLFDATIFDEADELGAAMMVTIEHISYAISQPFLLPYSWPTRRNRRVRQAVQVLCNHLQQFIDERRNNPAERNDLLSILLQARDENNEAMSDEQIMAECLNLFGAGHESTAIALTWAWYLLCQHPQIYQKVQREVDSVLQGRTPTYADLARLPYCLQVFKETLRLYPPVYFTCRRALREVEIDGYRIPKGRLVLLAPYTLHRRAEYFPEPETFEPERFAQEREKQLPRHAFVPFGAGPRICLGNHFTLMEGQLLLATIAQRAHLTLVPGQTIEPDTVHHLALRPVGKVNIVVTKR